MEISTGNPSLLKQRDIQTPFVAIIADVRLEMLTDKRGNQDETYVVYFTTGRPMKFNVINRTTVVAAYGKQREDWIGKPIEIYVDPNVYMGAERTGGIRVRIPAAEPIGTRPGSASAPKPVPPAALPAVAPKPAATAPRPAAGTATKPKPNLDDTHSQLLAGLDRASTTDEIEQWTRWGSQFAFSEGQDETAQHHRYNALERVSVAAGPTAPPRPRMAGA